MTISKQIVRPKTFFVLTFFLSWLIWIPLDLSHFGIGPLHIPEGLSSIVRLFGVLMPAVSALLLTANAGSGQAIRHLLGRLVVWRVGWKWWGAAVIIQPALLVLSGWLFNGIWGTPPIESIPMISFAALVVNIFFLLLATLGEEIGWRGVGLPELERQQSAAQSSLVLGLLWATWHIPFWLLLDTFDQFGWMYLGLNFLLVLPMTFYITWFFNHGRFSILLPVASHLSFNIVNTVLFPVTTNVIAFGLFIAMEWLIALWVTPRIEPATGIRDVLIEQP